MCLSDGEIETLQCSKLSEEDDDENDENSFYDDEISEQEVNDCKNNNNNNYEHEKTLISYQKEMEVSEQSFGNESSDSNILYKHWLRRRQ